MLEKNEDLQLKIGFLKPKNFRQGWAPGFNDIIKNIYENFNVHYVDKYDINLINNFDIIIDYEGLLNMSADFLQKIKAKKIVIMEDWHVYKSKTFIEMNFNYIDILLAKFNIIKNLNNFLNKHKFIDFPMYCTEEFLADKINFNAIPKIFMYGNINRKNEKFGMENQYRYRKEWYNYFSENIPDKFYYYKGSITETTNEIKKYSFGFVCTYFPYQFTEECRVFHDTNGCPEFRLDNNWNELKESYMIAKFFEVCGSGLLLLADTKYVENFFEEYGFINYENYININYENFNETISFLFNPENKDKINTIRLNGYNLIKENHTVLNRIIQFRDILKSL